MSRGTHHGVSLSGPDSFISPDDVERRLDRNRVLTQAAAGDESAAADLRDGYRVTTWWRNPGIRVTSVEKALRIKAGLIVDGGVLVAAGRRP